MNWKYVLWNVVSAPYPRPQWTNSSYNYCRMHCACMKRPYFHFRSKIWRHHHVPRPRFLIKCKNFSNLHTFKAEVGLLNICMGFRTFWPKMGVFWAKIGEGVVRYWLLMNSFFLWGFLRLCQFWWKWSRNATVRVFAHGQTHWLTDANRFYNLSHAICHSYGTDKNDAEKFTYLSDSVLLLELQNYCVNKHINSFKE